MAMRLRAILTDRATPIKVGFYRCYYSSNSVLEYTIIYYTSSTGIDKSSFRIHYYSVIAAKSFSSNKKRIRNTEAEFRVLQ